MASRLEGAPPVVLLTEAAVKQYFPNEDPIGKKIRLGWGRGEGKPTAGGEVVGIIGDVKDAGLAEAEPPQLYLPYAQWPIHGMSVVLATSVPPESVAEPARRAVYEVDPNMPASNVRTLDTLVAASISQPRFYMLLLSIFAGVALVLAAIGIFGVLSYSVAQRTREIGIRMALGARSYQIIGRVLRRMIVQVSFGFAAGVVCTLLWERMFPPGDPDIHAADPGSLTLVALTLMGLIAIAAAVPSRRASRVDPLLAIRAD